MQMEQKKTLKGREKTDDIKAVQILCYPKSDGESNELWI